MPGIITHLVYAEKYLRENPRKDFKRFILGTIFPDIRYIAGLERNLTHKKYKPDLYLSKLDAFKAGWKLHIYLDHRWSKLAKSSLIYNRYKNDIKVASAAAKIIEDMLDYKKIDDIGKYLKIIKNPGSGTALSIPNEKIKFYYSVSAEYLITKDYKSYAKYVLPEHMIDRVLIKVEEMKKDKELTAFLSGILEKTLP